MKVIHVMLSALCAALSIFLAGSLYSEITNQSKPGEYQKPAIVFDLGGVVFKTDKNAFVEKNLGGRSQIMPYALSNLSHILNMKTYIKKRWYETLEQVAVEHNNTFSYCDPDGKPIAIKDQDNKRIPTYMIEWLTGNRSNEELCNEICSCVEQHPEWFCSYEQEVMLNMTRGTFIPEQFVVVQQLIESMIKLMQQLKHEGYPIYILSNWDKESFALMIQMYPELSALCSGYMASGHCQMAKPDIRMNQCFEQQFVHPSYILIDDQKDNIAAAQAAGWFGIHTKKDNPSIKQIKKKIAQFDHMLHEQYTGQVAA